VIKVSLKEAEGCLGRLIDEAAAGQEVVIVDAGGRAVRLVPIPQVEPRIAKKVGHALDRFMGTWTAEEEAEFLKAVEVFEQVDESFWPSVELSVSEER
jgi:prevent-host-death family protein